MDLLDAPPITKAIMIGAVATSVAVASLFIDTMSGKTAALTAAFSNGQLWRIVTNFLYFGPLSLDFFFHIFFFMRYSKMLEENQFSGRKADYVWLLIVSSTLLLLLSPLSPAPFLSSPLSFTLVYLWSRLNPSVRLSLFGVVTITAPYLPYALVVFSWALASSWSAVIGDLLGITVGHVWYFFTRVWKHERGSGNRNWLATPPLLTRILDGRERIHVD